MLLIISASGLWKYVLDSVFPWVLTLYGERQTTQINVVIGLLVFDVALFAFIKKGRKNASSQVSRFCGG